MGGKMSTVSTKARSSRRRMTAASSDVSWPTSTLGSAATGRPLRAAWRSDWLILAAQPAKRANSVRRGTALSGDVGASGGGAAFMAVSDGLGLGVGESSDAARLRTRLGEDPSLRRRAGGRRAARRERTRSYERRFLEVGFFGVRSLGSIRRRRA